MNKLILYCVTLKWFDEWVVTAYGVWTIFVLVVAFNIGANLVDINHASSVFAALVSVLVTAIVGAVGAEWIGGFVKKVRKAGRGML